MKKTASFKKKLFFFLAYTLSILYTTHSATHASSQETVKTKKTGPKTSPIKGEELCQ